MSRRPPLGLLLALAGALLALAGGAAVLRNPRPPQLWMCSDRGNPVWFAPAAGASDDEPPLRGRWILTAVPDDEGFDADRPYVVDVDSTSLAARILAALGHRSPTRYVCSGLVLVRDGETWYELVLPEPQSVPHADDVAGPWELADAAGGTHRLDLADDGSVAGWVPLARWAVAEGRLHLSAATHVAAEPGLRRGGLVPRVARLPGWDATCDVPLPRGTEPVTGCDARGRSVRLRRLAD